MARINEAQPIRHANLCGDLEGVVVVINQPRVEWMILDYEKRVPWRMASKRLQDLINCASYVIERRMENNLRIRTQLKWKKIIRFIGPQ